MDNSWSDQTCIFYGAVSEFHFADWLPLLSEKEISRAEKYLLDSDKHSFIISKGILKRLLSHFLNLDAKQITFDYSKNGKPFLCEFPEFHFNVSHSGDALVIGLSHENEIGVDVENMNRKVNISKLENFLFTSNELEFFHSIQPDKKQELFINSWTKKEAVLKASGNGLTQAMNELELNTIDWFLESYLVMDNYSVAVAVKGHMSTVKFIPFSEFGLLFDKIG